MNIISDLFQELTDISMQIEEISESVEDQLNDTHPSTVLYQDLKGAEMHLHIISGELDILKSKLSR